MPTAIDRLWIAGYVLMIILLAALELVGPVNSMSSMLLEFRGLIVVAICLVAIAHVMNSWEIVDVPDEQQAASIVDPAPSLRQRHEKSSVNKIKAEK